MEGHPEEKTLTNKNFKACFLLHLLESSDFIFKKKKKPICLGWLHRGWILMAGYTLPGGPHFVQLIHGDFHPQVG